MLEVGVTAQTGGNHPPPLSYVESRTNFGAWCILSSPLIREWHRARQFAPLVSSVPPSPLVCVRACTQWA
jgi:hypothetical protein